ncbi:MAG TPA: alcohol dehydrogenase catalytic domain-containing protein [Flexivirga sp.]|uniref:alcohol dehydrogenase catalytic domain-containing protein n=1 Tax=Flexivirga sp. TaxID=1962927 RepID=UPI002BB8BB4E|nr:alcohol dehydrogenase catalytic domain-containing protein [Flexivirga sp.]HWC21774.1 alcohol dehydrogenase catalytic domain-containing protein [Flexivirga sp.]
MKALTWQGRQHVEVTDVPDPVLKEPTDAIVRVTSTAICGSDLHLYDVLTPFMHKGDILGHEVIGVIEEVGSEVDRLSAGDRVVVPFNISCGHCWMCRRGLQSQCETTQMRRTGKGARLFGYSSLYGAVPGGQAEFVRVPQAQYGPMVVPSTGADERYLYLSDVLPTAWQAVQYADVHEDDCVAVVGLGPIGQLCCRIASHLGVRVIGIDLLADRLRTAREHGAEVIDIRSVANVPEAVRDLTDGRGADGVIDAVGMEAHGDKVAGAAVGVASRLPSVVGRPVMEHLGVDRLAALRTALAAVRRGGTVSISGVYGGSLDPIPMMDLFDKGITLRMGQANVRRWTEDVVPLVRERDVFDLEHFATHHVPLSEAADAYRMFRDKTDDCLKVVLQP